MSKEIVIKLRRGVVDTAVAAQAMQDAADTIEQQQADIQELVEGLLIARQQITKCCETGSILKADTLLRETDPLLAKHAKEQESG